jgi:hypothetical protein
MQILIDLWLPILLSAVGAFVASSILWMATPLHKGDYTAPPDEDGLQRLIRDKGFRPGQYYIPWCTGGNMKDPAFLERMKNGPWGMLIVMGGPPSFGKSLGLWFLNQLLLAAIIGYAAGAAFGVSLDTSASKIVQVVGTIALLAYAGSWMEGAIWRGWPWRVAFVRLVDGLVYAAVTTAIFAWLWPRG